MITVTPDLAMDLMLRYLGKGPSLDNEELEFLVFALYLESTNNNGLAARATLELATRKPTSNAR